MMKRSALTDCRVGSWVADKDLRHQVTKSADKFRHRTLARICDDEIRDAFSWEKTYNGQLYWIEQIHRAILNRGRSAKRVELLTIACRAFDRLVNMMESRAPLAMMAVRSVTNPSTRSHMSLLEWAKVSILRQCTEAPQVKELPIPDKMKTFLLGRNKSRLYNLEMSDKPPAFYVFQQMYLDRRQPYPVLTLNVDYT